MSNIFDLQNKLPDRFKSIYLTNHKYYQYIVDKIFYSIIVFGYPLKITHVCSVFVV